MENNDNEIDLWQLLLRGLRFFRRREQLIISFFLIGIIFSVSNFFIHPEKYKSFYKKEFIAASSVTSNEILADIINAIPFHCNQHDSSVKYFPDFRNIKGKVEANINKETHLRIIIEAFEPKNIDETLKALAVYVNSNQALARKYELEKEQHLQLIAVLNNKIAECDSVKKYNSLFSCVELIEKKQRVEKQLIGNKIIDFTEINSEYIFVRNLRAGVLNVLGYGFLGLVLGFLAGLLFDVLKGKN